MKRRKIQSLIFLTFCLLGANLLKAQDVNYFLDIIGPDIDGSSVVDGYENQINIVSYGLSVSNNARVERSSGIVKENSQSGGLELLIQGDVKAIPGLFLNVNNGEKFTKMTLTAVYTESGFNPVIITLEECVIAALQQEGISGDLPVFSLQVVAEKISIKTKVLSDDGTGSAESENKWDYKANDAF
jgi:type VI protein secretion system component Hcp